MSREQWLATRAAARRRVGAPAITSCRLSRRSDGALDVVIEGANLRAGGVVANVRVGGRPVRDLVVDSAERWHGTVADAEDGDRITLDLGPLGYAEGTAVIVE